MVVLTGSQKPPLLGHIFCILRWFSIHFFQIPKPKTLFSGPGVGPQTSGLSFFCFFLVRYGSIWTKFQPKPSILYPNRDIYFYMESNPTGYQCIAFGHATDRQGRYRRKNTGKFNVSASWMQCKTSQRVRSKIRKMEMKLSFAYPSSPGKIWSWARTGPP